MINVIQRVVYEEFQLGDDTQLLTHAGSQLVAHLLLVVVDVLHNLLCPFAGEYTQVGAADTKVGADATGTHTNQYSSHSAGLLLKDITQFLLNQS